MTAYRCYACDGVTLPHGEGLLRCPHCEAPRTEAAPRSALRLGELWPDEATRRAEDAADSEFKLRMHEHLIKRGVYRPEPSAKGPPCVSVRPVDPKPPKAPGEPINVSHGEVWVTWDGMEQLTAVVFSARAARACFGAHRPGSPPILCARLDRMAIRWADSFAEALEFFEEDAT